MKKAICCSLTAIVFFVITSFTLFDHSDSVTSSTVTVEAIDTGTPFPITGKVTVYGSKGGRKQAVGEISYLATIEVNETDRGTYSIVSVRLNNLCEHDVSGHVYGIRNGQRTNFSKFEIVAENSWQETKTLSGKIDNITIDVLILDLGII